MATHSYTCVYVKFKEKDSADVYLFVYILFKHATILYIEIIRNQKKWKIIINVAVFDATVALFKIKYK